MMQFITAFGWTLLHSLWQGSVVALLLVAALTFLRHAEQRYWAACAALASIPLGFVLGLASHYNAVTGNPLEEFFVASKSQPFASFSTEEFSLIGHYLEPLLPLFVVFWALGVSMYTLVFVGGWFRLCNLRRTAETVSSTWQRRFSGLSQRLGVSDSVKLLESPHVNVPTVIGVFKPLVLVPASVMTSLTPAQLEAILIHELVHIRRHDPLINALQVVIETLFFYHPAVHWLSNVVRQEREYCCDDAVVALTGNALLYARALNELESLRHSSPKLVLAASGGPFMNRIRRLVQPQHPSRQPLRFVLVSFLLGGLLAACTSDALRRGASSTVSSEVGMYCFQSVSVRTGKHEMPAFNDASLRAMKTTLTERGYQVGCEDANATLNLAYEMVFDAQALSWQAWMLVSDRQGTFVELATAEDSIDRNGAFQYTTESTAQRLLGRLLDN